VEVESLQAVLSFLYETKVDVTPASLAGVLQAASRLEVSGLLRLGCDFLVESLSPETCIPSWLVADSIERPELAALVGACQRFALARFADVASSATFCQLPRARLRELLASDKLHVKEQTACEALICWLAEQTQAVDEQAKLALFSLIRIPLLCSDFLAKGLEPVLAGIDGGKELLFEAYRYQALSAQLRREYASPRTRPRRLVPSGVLLDVDETLLGGWTCHSEKSYLEGTRLDVIESIPASASHVFVGARRPDGTIALGAFGRRDQVLLRTRTSTETREENGVWWYNYVEDGGDEEELEAQSFGFSRVPEVELEVADILGSGEMDSPVDEDGLYRLSWHTADDGWRAGQEAALNHTRPSSSRWRQMLYYSHLI